MRERDASTPPIRQAAEAGGVGAGHGGCEPLYAREVLLRHMAQPHGGVPTVRRSEQPASVLRLHVVETSVLQQAVSMTALE